MLVANAAQPIKEYLWRRNISAFALHDFDDNPRDFLGRRRRLEKTLLDPVQSAAARAFAFAVFGAKWIAILVRIRNVNHIEHRTLETQALGCFRGSQRERAQSSSVKTVEEGNELFAAGNMHRKFQRRLNCLGAA